MKIKIVCDCTPQNFTYFLAFLQELWVLPIEELEVLDHKENIIFVYFQPRYLRTMENYLNEYQWKYKGVFDFLFI